MIIPNHFKLSRKRWIVQRLPYHSCEAGRCYASGRVIHLNNVVGSKLRTPRQLVDAFWHEATHAILFDMRSMKAHDEKFVQEFSKRLSELVHTAGLP